MLFLDGVCIDSAGRSRTRFRWVKAPTSNELTQLTHTIAQRVGRYLERQGVPISACGDDVRIIASIEDPEVISQILAHLAEKATAALLPPCRAPPVWEFWQYSF